MPMTAFDPRVHGFPFANRFRNNVAVLPGGAKIRTSGRCGGMAYAALDIFHAGRTAPAHDWSRFPLGVPPDGTPLADYLYRRLFDSYLEVSAVRFLAWTLLPDLHHPIFSGVTKWTGEEVRRFRAQIDEGLPLALGLVGARRIADVGRRNHQVVGIGYTDVRGGTDLHIHDNNHPGVTVTLRWRKGSSELESSHGAPWRGAFVHTYHPHVPPAQIWNPPPS